MEHGGKMEHWVFRKKHPRWGSVVASVWFSSLSNAPWHIKIKLIDDCFMNTTHKHNFSIFMNFDISIHSHIVVDYFDNNNLHDLFFVWNLLYTWNPFDDVISQYLVQSTCERQKLKVCVWPRLAKGTDGQCLLSHRDYAITGATDGSSTAQITSHITA